MTVRKGLAGRIGSMCTVGGSRRAVLGGALSVCLLGMLISLGWITDASAAAEAASEYQLKAVFLLNFTRFVEWPPQTFATPGEPFVICILGDDPFGSRLDEAIRNERVGDHPLLVRRLRKPEEAGGCEMLFIDRSQSGVLGQILTGLGHRAVLVVSEIDGAAEKGVMVQFATDNNRIRLRINAEAARQAGLVISSKLLHLADIVSTKPGD